MDIIARLRYIIREMCWLIHRQSLILGILIADGQLVNNTNGGIGH